MKTEKTNDLTAYKIRIIIDRIYNELFWIQVLGTPGVVIGVRSPSRASKSPASMYNVV